MYHFGMIKRVIVYYLILVIVSSFIANIATLTKDAAAAPGETTTSQSSDKVPPNVKITSPMYCVPLTHTGTFLFTGTANDPDSGIAKVEAFIETEPFGQSFPFKLATPKAPGDWSTWSIQLSVARSDVPYRVLVRATDKAGNENWDEGIYTVLLQPSSPNQSEILAGAKRVALVANTFTDGAYNVDGFYSFYPIYANVEPGVSMKDDLFRLTAVIPWNYMLGSDYSEFINHVKDQLGDDSLFSVLNDAVVDKGWIFDKNGNNAYDVLILTHNEYVTQQEYDNLREFTQNGGTIIFLDGNIFYAEVSFDESTCSVTLVKGHDWEYNGKIAKKSVSERYFSDNTGWVGSNYIINSLSDNVTFANNPFNYIHFEENYVSNPNAVILLDYGIKIPDEYSGEPNDRYAQVATYEMQYGKGKVIMLGIYSTNLQDNTTFMRFFDDVIMFHALSSVYEISDGKREFPIYWDMNFGSIEQIEVKNDTKSILVTLDESSAGRNADTLKIALPKRVIDVKNNSNSTNTNAEFAIFVDGKKVQGVDQIVLDRERIIQIDIPRGTSNVEIIGTQVIPELPAIQITGMMAMVFSVIILIGSKMSRHFRKDAASH